MWMNFEGQDSKNGVDGITQAFQLDEKNKILGNWTLDTNSSSILI